MLLIKNGWKQGGSFSPLLFNFALEYAISRLRVNQEGLKLNGLNGTHQLLVYADDVLLGGSMCTIERETGALVVSGKEFRSKC
jgi:hypothetical protein